MKSMDRNKKFESEIHLSHLSLTEVRNGIQFHYLRAGSQRRGDWNDEETQSVI